MLNTATLAEFLNLFCGQMLARNGDLYSMGNKERAIDHALIYFLTNVGNKTD